MNSRLLKTVHNTAKGLHQSGVMDKQTMHRFDALCLPPLKTYTPAEIKKIRHRCGTSQAVFAAYLNTASSTVQKWERGSKRPNGPSLKLLNLVEHKGLDALAY
jgi:putative transcriptional regulator